MKQAPCRTCTTPHSINHVNSFESPVCRNACVLGCPRTFHLIKYVHLKTLPYLGRRKTREGAERGAILGPGAQTRWSRRRRSVGGACWECLSQLGVYWNRETFERHPGRGKYSKTHWFKIHSNLLYLSYEWGDRVFASESTWISWFCSRSKKSEQTILRGLRNTEWTGSTLF